MVTVPPPPSPHPSSWKTDSMDEQTYPGIWVDAPRGRLAISAGIAQDWTTTSVTHGWVEELPCRSSDSDTEYKKRPLDDSD